jgi:DnaJ-class molecular chaperone
MYDLSQPNSEPGTCTKCKGTGTYSWGAMVNGKMTNTGTCFSCRGTGQQSAKQIKTNHAYNHFKIRTIMSSDGF